MASLFEEEGLDGTVEDDSIECHRRLGGHTLMRSLFDTGNWGAD